MKERKLNWETSGEGRNYFVKDRKDRMALLVYREDERTSKKLNRKTRKYEMITFPEHWHYQLMIDGIRRFMPCDTKEEAIKEAEGLFIQTLKQIEESVSFLKRHIK